MPRRPRVTAGWAPAVTEKVRLRAHFDDLVERALEELPDEARRALDNVGIVVAERGPRNLLGLYVGIPLTERDAGYTGVLPDVITLYRDQIEAKARTDEELITEVRTTVLHEIAHHFGIDDDRLHDLGWA